MRTVGGQEAGTGAGVGSDGADVADVVRNAWVTTLPGPFDPTLTWEEAGGDSLASLQLLLVLEKALCRKLSFDAIAPDMTVADMARSLSAPPALLLMSQTVEKMNHPSTQHMTQQFLRFHRHRALHPNIR